MSIVDFIPKSRLNFQGKKPLNAGFGNKDSKLHYTSSLNGQPGNGRVPSNLDLDAKTPPRYLDNPPK